MSDQTFPPPVTPESQAAFRAMLDRAVTELADPRQKLTGDQTLFSLRAWNPDAADRIYVVDEPYIHAHLAEIHLASYASTSHGDHDFAMRVFVCGLIAGGAVGVRATGGRETPRG